METEVAFLETTKNHLAYVCQELHPVMRSQINKFLNRLKNEGSVNTMHVLLVYLQRAPIEQRPLIAVVLLQLDLLGDSLGHSIYRAEAIDAIITFLDSTSYDLKVQEQSAKALLLLGGCFSYSGQIFIEVWLLEQAGMDDICSNMFDDKVAIMDAAQQDEEEKLIEWHICMANVLLTNGKKRLLEALSLPLRHGTRSLARACLVTIAWISHTLANHQDMELQLMACSVFAQSLIESLRFDRAIEERVLASFSLLNFSKNSGCLHMLSAYQAEIVGSLRSLTQVTWTAKDLLIATNNSNYTTEKALPQKAP